jgi:hypothetical protein
MSGGITDAPSTPNEPVDRLSDIEYALWVALEPEFDVDFNDPENKQAFRNMIARVQKLMVLELISLPAP